jgi:hypothetical protein
MSFLHIRIAVFLTGAVLAWAVLAEDSPPATPLRISVYATAGSVQELASEPERQRVLRVLEPLGVTRLFLEGRRGDQGVSPTALAEVRDWFQARGIACAGGIATVPGQTFGLRQTGGLDWLNWESERTRRDVVGFFTVNAPVFRELIVDDFFCTGDTSVEGDRARGARSWGDYRRDLLVSLLEPLVIGPARAARSDVRLILKFPQWYDRFHRFGYDPPRMAQPFDQVWVGTEVRDPKTRRMGYVQPTEGYMNFRWISSVVGPKTVGAWFDHIECSPQNFVDQAFLSVLAGARELTLFSLADVVGGHGGDARLAQQVPELRRLAARIEGRARRGLPFYKPPGSEAEDNVYLADYLGMIGLPVLPVGRFPEGAASIFLAAQAAADPEITDRLRRHLDRGSQAVVTPAFLRRVPAVGSWAGVSVTAKPAPGTASTVEWRGRAMAMDRSIDLDGGLGAGGGEVVATAHFEGGTIPFLTAKAAGAGRLLVLNVRTFSDQDFLDTGEWLLAPKALGLPEIPQALADPLRREILADPGLRFEAPAGVSLHDIGENQVVYSFLDRAVVVRLNGVAIDLPPHGWHWRAGTGE